MENTEFLGVAICYVSFLFSFLSFLKFPQLINNNIPYLLTAQKKSFFV